MRAAAILACAEGTSDTAVAAQFGCSTKTVAAWRNQFAELRLDSLDDRPRGRPARGDTRAAENAVLIALTRPGPGGRLWTNSAMATETGLSARTVAALWSAARISPHRTDLSHPGVDPLWHGHARTLAGLYLSPGLRLLACWVAVTPPRRVDTSRALTGWDTARDHTLDLLAATDTRIAAVQEQSTQPGRAANAEHNARLRRALAELDAARPDGVTLHLVADRPIKELPAPVRRLAELPRPASTRPSAGGTVVSTVPTPTTWTALSRSAITVTTWEHHLRQTSRLSHGAARPDGLLLHWRDALLAAAYGPQPTATHTLIRPSEQARALLELMGEPRPRTRHPVEVSVPSSQQAWVHLAERHASHPRHHWPDRPHLALTHLRRHADELTLTGDDAIAALVLHTDHRRHLDLVDHLLHRRCSDNLVRRRGAATALGISVDRLDDLRAALARTTATAASTLHLPRRRADTQAALAHSRTPSAVEAIADRTPQVPIDPYQATPDLIAHLHPDALADWLVEHWLTAYEQLENPDHHLPAPDDPLAVAEHVLTHSYPTARDVREVELLSALRLIAHLRTELTAQHEFWLAQGRRQGESHARLGAATARSAGASRTDHHARTKTTAQPSALGNSDRTIDNDQPVPYWQPHTDRIHTILASLLTPEHRRVIRRNRGLRDTLDELDHALDRPEDHHEPSRLSTAAVGWLLVLIGELGLATMDTDEEDLGDHNDNTTPDLDDHSLTLSAELCAAVILRRDLHAARDGTPPVDPGALPQQSCHPGRR